MERLSIVVAGLIGSIPLPGLTFHYLQYVLGLQRLGHRVLYLEDTGTAYYDPVSDTMGWDATAALHYLRDVMDRFGLGHCWTFVDSEGAVHGVSGRARKDLLDSADLFLNVTGAGLVREEYLRIPRRAYIDTDPGFMQFRAAGGSERDLLHLGRHTDFFSFGCNIGMPNCPIPTLGYAWQPTAQPIVLSLWPVAPLPGLDAPFTTVMKWKTYPPVEFGGEQYGMKDVEFERFIELPSHTAQPLELAMTGAPPVADLERRGWRCRKSREVCHTLDAYQTYIRGSRGEWSIAKNGYVKTRSGWFSERSACYLATGRPVVVQDTGFSGWMETGSGTLAFTTVCEAAAGLEAVRARPGFHAAAARNLAEAYFDSDRVLEDLIERALASSSPHD